MLVIFGTYRHNVLILCGTVIDKRYIIILFVISFLDPYRRLIFRSPGNCKNNVWFV